MRRNYSWDNYSWDNFNTNQIEEYVKRVHEYIEQIGIDFVIDYTLDPVETRNIQEFSGVEITAKTLPENLVVSFFIINIDISKKKWWNKK